MGMTHCRTAQSTTHLYDRLMWHAVQELFEYNISSNMWIQRLSYQMVSVRMCNDRELLNGTFSL